MKFDFSEDQRLLQQTVRDFLEGACPVERLRESWESETGRSPELWAQLAEIGVPGLLVPEEHGGLGMNEIDQVLILEETGRAALAEPVIATAAVGVPLICELGDASLAKEWLGRIAEGNAIVAVADPANRFVADAHVANLLLVSTGDEIHGVDPATAKLVPQRSNDPSRRIFDLRFEPSSATRLADGETAARASAAAFDRGALACAAEALGVGDQLISMAVAYATERKQFGVPIGSFQAVKHMLANAKVRVEYARSVVYRAAHSVAHAVPSRAVDVSTAKAAACEAAAEAGKIALQVHGAIGYTWEQDLHVWMRRAWSLQLAWGDGAWHRDRVGRAVIDGEMPAETFGYSAPAGAAA
jgi:alkylation response protein AidB-like acyl-CoA dehydrogenase